MLKPYEISVVLKREVAIEPHLLNCDKDQIIKDKVWETMKRVCSSDYGFVLRLNSIDNIGDGNIDQDTGNVVYPVTFTVTTFKPKVNDIIIAKVSGVSKSGFFCVLGPFEVFVPHINIPSSYEFFYTGTNDVDIENGTGIYKSKYTTISNNEYVKIKLCAVSKMDMQQIRQILPGYEKIQTPYLGGVLQGIGEILDE